MGIKCNLFLLCIIGLCSTTLASRETVTKEDGTVVYKFVDRDGMAWEYEQKVLKLEGISKPSKVMVFNGPWTPETRSGNVHNSPVDVMLFVLSLGALTMVNSSIQFIGLSIYAHLFGHASH